MKFDRKRDLCASAKGFCAALAAISCLSSCMLLSSENHGVLAGALFDPADEMPPNSPAPRLNTAAPRLIVGIEKFEVQRGQARIATSSADGLAACDSDASKCVDLRKEAFLPIVRTLWADRLDDRTQQIVTHIVDVDDNGECAELHFSAYGQTKCGDTVQPVTVNVDESWSLLNRGGKLQAVIEQHIERQNITHIVVLTTGWRVQQKDSISSTAGWINQLDKSFGGAPYKPLYILLTWPAYRSDWMANFLNKGHDADEVGLTWANVFVNRTLATLKSRDKVNVVLIGHSFGARLLSTATFSGEAIGAPNCGGADLLIGLQAAFSNARFLGSAGDRDGGAYRVSAECKTKTAYTTSRRDEGVPWAPTQLFGSSKYMGTASTYDRAMDPDEREVLEAGTPTGRDRVFVINADDAICNHNDVAGEWTSWTMASLINTFANKRGPWIIAAEPTAKRCK